MLDPTIMYLNHQMDRMDEYERKVPICDECGQRLTADDYYWDMNSTILCERCLLRFRKSVEDFIEGGD